MCICLGVLAVGLGTAGIFVPLLPTTPFLLLAAFLFARSSSRWHAWLLRHKRLGPYIHAFRGQTGLTRAQKLQICGSFTILLWITILLVPHTVLKCLLCAMWLFWMVYIYRIRAAAHNRAHQHGAGQWPQPNRNQNPPAPDPQTTTGQSASAGPAASPCSGRLPSGKLASSERST